MCQNELMCPHCKNDNPSLIESMLLNRELKHICTVCSKVWVDTDADRHANTAQIRPDIDGDGTRTRPDGCD